MLAENFLESVHSASFCSVDKSIEKHIHFPPLSKHNVGTDHMYFTSGKAGLPKRKCKKIVPITH